MKTRRGPGLGVFGLLIALSVTLSPAPAQAAGNLDPSFGTGGKVTTAFPAPASASDMTIGPNGRIVVAGTVGGNFAVAAYHPDGSRDTTFGGDGRVVTDFGAKDTAGAVAIHDGKVIVAGESGPDFAVARYMSDGSMDPSFGVKGRVLTPIGNHAAAYGVAVQGNGKVVVAGTDLVHFVLVRYTPGGTPDATFGGDGKVVTSFSGNARAYSVALQRDGKIVALGENIVGGCSGGGCDTLMAVARYRRDGELDRTFSGDGKNSNVEQSSAGFDVHDVAIQPDGGIVGVAGTVMARFKADGRLDTTFGKNGSEGVFFVDRGNDEVVSVAVDGHGRIVGAGTAFGQTNCCHPGFGVGRWLPAGARDQSFGTHGVVKTTFPDRSRGAAVALDPEGRIVVAGTAGGDFALARYLSA